MASDKSPSDKVAFEERTRAQRFAESALGGGGRRIKNATGDILLTGMLQTGSLETKASVTRPYEENEWVHACVKAKGQAVASVPLVIWLGEPGKDKNAKPLPPTDPLSRLFAKPMPFMTGCQFFEAGCHHRSLDGEDFWFLLDERGQPIQAAARIPIPRYILPVRGARVTLERNSETGWPERWQASQGSGPQLIAPVQSVIQFRDYNLDDPLRGLGDAEALTNIIDMSWQAWRYQRALLKNAGDPGGWISTEGTLAPDEAEAAENEAKELYSVQNAGQWKVISGKGLTFTPNKVGPRDMEFKSMHPWNRDAILGIFGVPPPIVGVLEYATLANFVECVRMFWQGGNGVLAYLRTVEDVITHLLLRDLAHPQAQNLYAKFDTSGIEALQADRNQQLEIAEKLAQANLGINFVEACALVGIDIDGAKLEYGDQHFIGAGITTVDAALELAANPPEPILPPDPAPAPASDGNGDGTDTGKSAEVAVEEPSEGAPLQRDADPAPVEPDPAEVARADRRAYWATKEADILRAGEAALRSRYRSWSKEYESKQLKRLRDFANDGAAALRSTDRFRKDGPNDHVPFDDLNTTPFNVDDLLLPKAEQALRMKTRFTDPVKGIWANALEDIATEIGAEFPMLATDPSVIAALESQLTNLVDGHVDFLANRVKDALTEALSKATNQASLQAAVEEVLPELTDELRKVFGDRATRANTIARTETARAANTARNMEMVHTGVATQEWITQHDAAVRGTPGGPYADSEYSHAELDGQSWSVGGLVDPAKHPHLKYPGDPDGEPGDTIQCRCLARPVLQKDSTNQ